MKSWIPHVAAVGMVALGLSFLAFRMTHPPAPPTRAAVAPASEASPPEVRAVAERMQLKRQIAGDVLAGRVPLLHAAAAFRNLDNEWPKSPVDIRIAFPAAASAEEAYCRAVIDYARAEASGDEPDRVHQLEDELASHLRAGSLVLPER